MAHQFDLFLSRPRRESRIAATTRDWVDDALIVAERELPWGEVMGEDFRRLPIPRPGDVSWWGQLVRAAIDAGIITKTDRFAPSDSRANHAHHYRIYIRGQQ